MILEGNAKCRRHKMTSLKPVLEKDSPMVKDKKVFPAIQQGILTHCFSDFT
jgi:hypothetical protein